MVYVKSAFIIAWGNGFEKAGPPQKACRLQLIRGKRRRRNCSFGKRIPIFDERLGGFLFQHEKCGDVCVDGGAR
jgi:hypothetical protein